MAERRAAAAIPGGRWPLQPGHWLQTGSGAAPADLAPPPPPRPQMGTLIALAKECPPTRPPSQPPPENYLGPVLQNKPIRGSKSHRITR